MIPKRAIFFYEGPPMSWLRQQSIETFKKCNPDWEVVMIDGAKVPIPKNGLLSIVHRSDWARYIELHERGGFYFDTDIVFYEPMLAEWSEAELVLPVVDNPDRRVAHVATMGCMPGEPFFRDAAQICKHTVEQSRYLNYQALGVLTLNKTKRVLAGRDVKWINSNSLLPIPWDETERLWNPYSGTLPPMTCGIHWFGGDHVSIQAEKDADEAWLIESQCMVAKAIRKARAL